MEHLGTVQLETNRLILRKFELADAQDMYTNWANDDAVTKYLTWPTHKDVETSEQVITSWIKDYTNLDNYQWAIELKESQKVIGSIAAVHVSDELKAVEIGYCISRLHWHQGIVSEALTELIRFFFKEVQVNRITARHDLNNGNSGLVMQKCGLKLEGVHLQADKNNTGICDMAVYGLILDEYNKA